MFSHTPPREFPSARLPSSPAVSVVPELRDGLGVEGSNAAPQALRAAVVLVPRHKHSAAAGIRGHGEAEASDGA